MSIRKMYDSGMSLSEIAKELGMSVSTVRRRVLSSGDIRSVGDGVRLRCKRDGGRPAHRGIKRRPISDETRRKMSESRKALNLGKGFRKTSSGYIEITKGENAGRLEHVIKIEQEIGRRLFSNECVHHIDGNRENNDLSNLRLMTRSEHSSLHAKEAANKRLRDKKGKFK